MLVYNIGFLIIGGILYGIGQWIGFGQGRKSLMIKDEAVRTFDPGEQSADIVDPYFNALHGIETKPGEDTKERIDTV